LLRCPRKQNTITLRLDTQKQHKQLFWMSVASWCAVWFCVVLCVCLCTGHFVRVPLNLNCLDCLQHFFFEHLFNLYWTLEEISHAYLDQRVIVTRAGGSGKLLFLTIIIKVIRVPKLLKGSCRLGMHNVFIQLKYVVKEDLSLLAKHETYGDVRLTWFIKTYLNIS